MQSRIYSLSFLITPLILAGVAWLVWPTPESFEQEHQNTSESEQSETRAPSGNANSGPIPGPYHPDMEEAAREKQHNKSPIDLKYVESQLPDNLYWAMDAPTEDTHLLEERKRQKDYWNKQYGKVLSNTGTKEEIRHYYNHKKQVSKDYYQLTKFMLDTYRDKLPPRDIGLMELGLRMHADRLKQYPRDEHEALARKAAYDKRKTAWANGR